MPTIDYFLVPARVFRGRSEKLTEGITPAMAARKPIGDRAGVKSVVNCNHATFLFGHLAIYPARMLERVGLDPAPIRVSDHWESIFKAGVECLDDPDGKIYPAFADVRAHYFRATDHALAQLGSVDDATLAKPPAEERLRAMFPNIGCMLNFLLNAHVAMHMGQLSTWRRCMGLGSVE